MISLSKAQKEIIDELSSGLYLWTNEGEVLRAWLGDSIGNKSKSVRVRTVEILHEKGLIEFIDGDYADGLFKYKLDKSKLKRIKR